MFEHFKTYSAPAEKDAYQAHQQRKRAKKAKLANLQRRAFLA